MGSFRSTPGTLLTMAAAAFLLGAMPFEAEAQVRRSAGGQAAARPQPAPAQRPATAPRPASGARQTTASGNTRISGGSNVAIGNDVNIVRPPATGGRAPAYAPPAYRGAVAVPVYPGYYDNSSPSTGEIIAAGVIAGATAGVISGAMQQPATTTATAAPPPAATAPATAPAPRLEIGTQLSALPSGCTTSRVRDVTYYLCGTAWLQGHMQGGQLVYIVVPPPAG